MKFWAFEVAEAAESINILKKRVDDNRLRAFSVYQLNKLFRTFMTWVLKECRRIS